MAALMSTADTLINAVSAVFVNDVYRPYISKDRTDKHYLLVARIASLSTALIGLALVPVFLAQGSIYSAHGMFTAAVTPPIVMAIFLGVLWKRFNAPAALATMIGGGALVALSLHPKLAEPMLRCFSFGMGPDSYKFTRALLGIVSSGVIGIVVTLITKPQPMARIVGLVNGTQLDAMRMYKGGEINRRDGDNAYVTVRAEESLAGIENALLPQAALDTMAAEVGDIIYVCDRRWWLGGLHSVHSRITGISPDDAVHLGPEAMQTAHFADGAAVYVEKVC